MGSWFWDGWYWVCGGMGEPGRWEYVGRGGCGRGEFCAPESACVGVGEKFGVLEREGSAL